MKHKLPDLPYPVDALEPFLSQETLEYHHCKHHRAYVEKVNELISGTEFNNKSLDYIVQHARGPLFDNAAQAWNHNFYWKCLTPDHHQISGRCLTFIENDFDSLDHFQAEFIKQGKEVFGSGWLWLIEEEGQLKIMSTHDGDNPLAHGKHAVLNCDLWEHAYYIDYRNQREKYLEAFVEIINWDFVEGNIKKGLIEADAA